MLLIRLLELYCERVMLIEFRHGDYAEDKDMSIR